MWRGDQGWSDPWDMLKKAFGYVNREFNYYKSRKIHFCILIFENPVAPKFWSENLKYAIPAKYKLPRFRFENGVWLIAYRDTVK